MALEDVEPWETHAGWPRGQVPQTKKKNQSLAALIGPQVIYLNLSNNSSCRPSTMTPYVHLSIMAQCP